jgi:hypothetical protein
MGLGFRFDFNIFAVMSMISINVHLTKSGGDGHTRKHVPTKPEGDFPATRLLIEFDGQRA